MIVNNRVCKLLGTEYPLLQGGMAWVANAALAAAVSNAGGIKAPGGTGHVPAWA